MKHCAVSYYRKKLWNCKAWLFTNRVESVKVMPAIRNLKSRHIKNGCTQGAYQIRLTTEFPSFRANFAGKTVIQMTYVFVFCSFLVASLAKSTNNAYSGHKKKKKKKGTRTFVQEDERETPSPSSTWRVDRQATPRAGATKTAT